MIEITKGGHVKYIDPARLEHYKKNGWSQASEKIVLKPAKKTVAQQPAVEQEVDATIENKGDLL